jgi:hypothetical protein
MPDTSTDIKSLEEKIRRNEAFAKAQSETLITAYQLIAEMKHQLQLLTALETTKT